MEALTEVASSATGIDKLRRSFTLVELVCVLAISMLLLALVIGRVGKTPLFLSLNKVSLTIQNLMSTASSQAELNNNIVTIVFRNWTFQPDSTSSFSSPSYNNYLTYTPPSGLAVEFAYPPGQKMIIPTFLFFPDGTASGPDIILTLKAQRIVIHISKLTGQPVVISK